MPKIKKVFKPLYTTDKRYVIMTGGRASLKSSTAMDFIIRSSYQKGRGIFFTRYQMTSASKSIIPDFESTVKALGCRSDFYITTTRAINKRTGSFIWFSGLRSSSGAITGDKKGLAGVNMWVIEEGEDFTDERLFDTIDDTIRGGDLPIKVVWIQNPSTREHFIFKRFFKDSSKLISLYGFDVRVSTHPMVEHIHTTYHQAMDLGYLDAGWVAKARAAYLQVQEQADLILADDSLDRKERDAKVDNLWHTSYYYYNYIGGWLERDPNAVFPYWSEGAFDDSLPFCYGLDFGFSPDPLAICKVAVDSRNFLIYVDEVGYDTEVPNVGEYLKARGVSMSDLIVADTNEPRTLQDLASVHGLNVAKARKEKIVDDIREINKYRIIITPQSSNARTELSLYKWNDRKASIPIDKNNHLMDAMRYGFRRLFSGSKRSGVRRKN